MELRPLTLDILQNRSHAVGQGSRTPVLAVADDQDSTFASEHSSAPQIVPAQAATLGALACRRYRSDAPPVGRKSPLFGGRGERNLHLWEIPHVRGGCSPEFPPG